MSKQEKFNELLDNVQNLSEEYIEGLNRLYEEAQENSDDIKISILGADILIYLCNVSRIHSNFTIESGKTAMLSGKF